MILYQPSSVVYLSCRGV